MSNNLSKYKKCIYHKIQQFFLFFQLSHKIFSQNSSQQISIPPQHPIHVETSMKPQPYSNSSSPLPKYSSETVIQVITLIINVIIMLNLIEYHPFLMNSSLMTHPTITSDCQLGYYDSNCQITDKKDYSEIEFVSQFLVLNRNQPIKQLKMEEQTEKIETEEVNQSENKGEEWVNLQNSSQNKKKRSVFHNFQKHLVTTLKMSIQMNKINLKKDPTVTLAHKMWRIFVKSNYFSKKILHFLFGVTTSGRQQKNVDPKEQIFPGFKQILLNHKEQDIKLAQQYLREEVVRQGKRLLNKKILCNRRMQKSQQFQSYFKKFIQEIESGAISKRLSKPSKLSMMMQMGKVMSDSI